MPTVGLDGTRFYYEERGKGPALVLVHGTGGSTPMVAAAAGLLATSHRVITYDRRGFGDTSCAPPPKRTYLRRHADDLALLARELGAVPSTLVGWSWGGLVALAAAVHHPSLFREIVLYEPPFHVGRHMSLDVARAFAGVLALGKLRMHERAAERFYKWAMGKKQWKNMAPELKKRALAHSKTVVAEIAAGSGEELTTSLLHRVKVPVSIVVGGESHPAFAEAADRLVRIFPRARVVRMPHGDHVTIFKSPTVLVDAVRDAMSKDPQSIDCQKSRTSSIE